MASHFGEGWWQEVFLLMLALAERPSAFKPLFRELLQKPAFVQGAALVEQCLEEAAEVSPDPFVGLLRNSGLAGTAEKRRWFRMLARWFLGWLTRVGLRRPALGPGTDPGLEERQLAALNILERHFPEALDGLLPELAGHPFAKVRLWAQQRGVAGAQTVVCAEQGGYELVLIPGGRSLMGSPKTEVDRYDDEGPVHEVQVPSFYLGPRPVTNEEYARFLKEKPKMREPDYWGDRQYNQARQPVVGVDWTEAKQYCAWAGLRLPSEAEWEYACRAGTSTRFWSGDSDEDLARVGWYVDNSGRRLHPVGEKEANPFGLYDMHGNVWEWVEDDWHGNYKGVPGDGSAWVDKSRGADRVNRGGSWGNPARLCRSAYRSWYGPGIRLARLGFRPARSIP